MGVVAAALAVCPLASAQYVGLVINEILPNPRNASGVYLDANQDGATNVFDDEFIELLNTSTGDIDVAGCWLTDANTNIRRHVFSARILPAGGSIVVFGGGSLLNFSNPPAQIATGGGLSLNNNEQDIIHLFSPQTALVDQVSYQLTASHDAISTVRNPDGSGAFTNHYLATTNTSRASPGRRIHGTPFLTNQPPVFVDLPAQTAFVGLELRFPLRAYDPADRDAISLSVVGNPAGSALSATGGVGTFTFTATANQAGQTFNVAFVATDGDGTTTNVVAIQAINPNSAEDIWINEIHYENVGTDGDEGVEIAGTAGSVLSDYALVLYNDNDGKAYDTNTLTGTLDNEQCGFGAAWFGYVPNGIQNGPSDGIALVKGTNLIQFISYEGVLTASNGPAAGQTSVDIGVRESDTTPTGESLQLTGTGTVYSAFAWTNARPHSRGSLNTGQGIECRSPAAIELQKTVYLGHDAGASAPGSDNVQGTNGAAVTYVFVVANTGGTALTNVGIDDVSLGISLAAPGTLATGAVSTAYVETVISGDLRNTATVTGYDPDGLPVTDDDTAEVVEIIPSIDIQFTAYRGHDGGAACPGSGFLQATNGTPVTFCLVVENNGNTNVNSIVVSNASLGIAPILVGTLPSGGVFATSVAAVVTGSWIHVATVDGTDPNDDPVSDQDSVTVEIIAPALLLQKSVYLGHDSGASCPGAEQVEGTNGTPLTYCFHVSNIGDTPLTGVVLSDAGLPGFPDTALGTLEPAASASLFFEATLLASRINTATATAVSVIGTLVQDADSATATLTAPTNDLGSGEYIVVHLGTLGGATSDALGINDRGQAVGWSRDALNRPQAFLWQNGSMSGLGFLPGGEISVAQAINNHGEIAGYARVSASDSHSFFFSTKGMVDLGTLGGPSSWARAINDSGDVTGSSLLASNIPNPWDAETFVWRSNRFIHVFPYSSDYLSVDGYGINREGRICGVTFLYSPNPRYWGFVWFDNNTNGLHEFTEMKLLGSMAPKDSGGEYSQANALNDIGQAVGWTGITNTAYPRQAFLVTSANGQWKIPDTEINPTNSLMQTLGALESPTNNSSANDINNSSWIVGYSTTASGTNQAFLWRNGVLTNLNELIPPNSGWVLTNATGINEHNEIVGSGLYQGQSRAYMLRQGGRISKVVPIIQTNLRVYTNEFDEVVTQEIPHVEAQVLEWAGIWSTNVDIPVNFTVEYCNHLQTHEWAPVAPTSQWPILVNFWTNTDFNSIRMRHFRIRAQEL